MALQTLRSRTLDATPSASQVNAHPQAMHGAVFIDLDWHAITDSCVFKRDHLLNPSVI